ncbi:hypothetical protein MAR_026853 [Mya arenaria]|uniref:Uncharacterized protein n=1 Tax=Mya arenaria TaxID=6604 RepID=A0ABY7ERT7_MYAAR|nr:hypothetical protein MAR_026853 [Mya arenaria]
MPCVGLGKLLVNGTLRLVLVWGNIKCMAVVEVIAVCAVLSTIAVSAHVCTPSKLSDRAFDQCGQTGFAMKCNGRRLHFIPSEYPIPSPPLSGPACVLDLSDNNINVVGNETFTEAKKHEFN